MILTIQRGWCFINSAIFRNLNLEIASAIPASNVRKIATNKSAAPGIASVVSWQPNIV